MVKSSVNGLQLAIPVLTIAGFAAAFPQEPKGERAEAKPTPWIDAAVVPGEGFAGVHFGDSANDVERKLGEPNSADETARMYGWQGFEVKLYDGRVAWFTFYPQFRGRLADSGLGIDDTLADIERAYGSIVTRREVDELWGWSLHRVLLLRRNGPAAVSGILARLCYLDRGVCFYLDGDERIVGFLVGPKRPVSTNDRTNRPGMSKTAWYAIQPIGEREGFAGIRFGDSPARVEEVLGNASSGSDNDRRFTNPDIRAAFEDGRLRSLRFGEDFRGRLSETGIRMGDTVEDVLTAYGEALAQREVENLSAWHLDRTLVRLRSKAEGSARGIQNPLP